jgi:hypothetical protein
MVLCKTLKYNKPNVFGQEMNSDIDSCLCTKQLQNMKNILSIRIKIDVHELLDICCRSKLLLSTTQKQTVIWILKSVFFVLDYTSIIHSSGDPNKCP